MKNLNDLFESLYTQFVLRDLLGKALPGFCALYSIVYIFCNDPIKLLIKATGEIEFLIIGIGYGLSFIVGLTLQFIGDKYLGMCVYKDCDMSKALKSIKAFLECNKDNPLILRQRERFVVLKDLSRNFAVSVLVIIISVSVKTSGKSVLAMASILILTCLFCLLIEQHGRHQNEQDCWEELNTKSCQN